MKTKNGTVTQGVVAGLVGAFVVAVWYLLFDLARGRPFETPALLAGALLHGTPVHWPPAHLSQMVLEYSGAHIIAFLAVGVIASELIAFSRRDPIMAVPLMIFFAAFEVFFLVVVMLLGPSVSAEIAWWSILVANLLATAAMGFYLSRQNPFIRDLLLTPWTETLQEGVICGALGAAVVVVCFVWFDLQNYGEIFRTPSLLGTALLEGIRQPPDTIRVAFAPVASYTVLHFLAFILFGITTALLVAASEREPMLLRLVFVMFLCFEFFFVGFVKLADEQLLEALGWRSIVAANIMASFAMGTYLYLRHRSLVGRLADRWREEARGPTDERLRATPQV